MAGLEDSGPVSGLRADFTGKPTAAHREDYG